MDVFCLSCPNATFAHQHGGFVSREWLAAKGLFHLLRQIETLEEFYATASEIVLIFFEGIQTSSSSGFQARERKTKAAEGKAEVTGAVQCNRGEGWKNL